jgi:hypothetical protein
VSETGDIRVDLKSGRFLSITVGDNETLFRLTDTLKFNKWYGIIVNISSKVIIDIFEELGQLERIMHLEGMRNKYWKEMVISNYQIMMSNSYITNIRLYDTANTEIDKQLIDLTTYNIPDNYHAIINDSVDIYLDKKYIGIKG